MAQFASGGDTVTNDPCVQLAGIKGINALLADADTCDQQDNADAMIDFAKSRGITNANALIANAIAYRKHPRNAVNMQGTIPSTPYCQKPPKNQELLGVVNDQLPGLNPYVFGGTTVGMVPFGDRKSKSFTLGAVADDFLISSLIMSLRTVSQRQYVFLRIISRRRAVVLYSKFAILAM